MEQSGQNLSSDEVSRRLRLGIFALFAGLVLAIVFDLLESSATVRVWTFVPFFIATNSFHQGVYKTCGFSALRGFRNTSCGAEPIADPSERRACLRRGKKQILHSLVGATLLTVAFVWMG